jgi:hypothetical protein
MMIKVKTKIIDLIRKAFNFFGLHIIPLPSEKYIPRDMDVDFKEVYLKCRPFTMTSIERMFALYKAVKYIIEAKIPGDFVECGVWRGR